jgi:sulfofructose kinase
MNGVKARIDLLGLGCTAVDELLYVDAYPPADAKVPVRRRERQCGGLTATALVAAARLGAKCAYAGTLGDDEHSRFVIRALAREGVDTRPVVRRLDARPVRSVIVVDERRQTRTIFYDVKEVQGAHPTLPTKRLILSSRVLFVDRFGIEGMLRAAGIARAAGIPVVADFESTGQPGMDELLKLADHLIVSEEFAFTVTKADHPALAAARLRRGGHAVVVVTCGERGCWFQECGWPLPRHQPSFAVRAVDTTGCGDVFHGAYAFALARGLSLGERIHLASATAALKAMRRGGQAGIPTLREVRRFLEQQGQRVPLI